MKILYVTTIGGTMNFFKAYIKELVEAGHIVDIATNENEFVVPDCYHELGCVVHQIDFSRSPLSADNIKAYGQLKKLIESSDYDIVHCHTPNASVITRLVCRKSRKKTGLKVFYTAHGFHFYKGAPKLNWLVFFPIEKYCSRFTDKLITINQEDFALAKSKLKAKETYYVPGVGIDLSRFENIQVDKTAKRQEIGVPEDAFLLLSVGELNENKNHQIIIKALAKVNDPKIHYAIAGVGDQKDRLLHLAESLGVSGQVHLLGYRNDIPELNYSADAFCFPSIREGLGLAAVEAMACKVPVIAAENRGTRDVIENGVTGLLCDSDKEDTFADAMVALIENVDNRIQMGEKAHDSISRFKVNSIIDEMLKVYGING